jgi:hypothetical protein
MEQGGIVVPCTNRLPYLLESVDPLCNRGMMMRCKVYVKVAITKTTQVRWSATRDPSNGDHEHTSQRLSAWVDTI